MELVTVVDDLADYVRLVIRFKPGSRSNSPFIFRGVPSVNFKLLPSVGREELWPADHLYDGARGTREHRSFEVWKAKCHSFLERKPADDLEYLLLAQHHGVPTRLLDWTYSPLIALYFALGSPRDGADAVVYCRFQAFVLGDSKLDAERRANPFATQGHMLVNPPWIGARVAAQQSCFLLFGEPKVPLDPDREGIFRLIIPRAKVAGMLRDLHQLGVHAEMVFPDLDGVGRSVTYDWFGPMEPEPSRAAAAQALDAGKDTA